MIAALLTGARAIGSRLGLSGYICIGLAALLLVQTVRIDGLRVGPVGWHGLKDKYETALTKLKAERKGRLEDRSRYEDAQAKAAELNKAEVNRIVGEQDRISNDIESDLRARLERLRSELRKGTPASPGHPKGPGAGPDGKPAPGTPEAPAMCLSTEELLRAAEDEERHDQLITWVEEQLRVRR